MSIQREALEAARNWIRNAVGVGDHPKVLNQIDAALSAPTEQVPDGWKLVPVEPTREMWAAVNKLDDEMAAGAYDGKGCTIEQAWECLLAASPSAPTAVQPAYPEGDVVAACVCGSWPGGKCLKCPWVPATPTAVQPAACRDDGRCQYAIDSGAEGLGHCPAGKCVMPATPTAVKEAGGLELTTCNCRWSGEHQVQWCGLHDAHREAIHEWAARAKTAEAALARAAQPTTPVAPQAFRTPEPGTPWWQTAKDCGAWTDRQEGDVGYVHFGSTEALRVYTVKIANQVRESLATPVAPKTLEALTEAEVDDLSREMVRGGKAVNWLAREFGRRLAAKNNMTLGAPDGN